MAADTLHYQGINRAITDYSGARACEELINLRPTTDGLVPVKPFTVKKSNVAWSRIFLHHSTGGDKYFVVKRNTGSVSVHLLDANMDPVSTALFTIITSSDAMQERVVGAVSFAAAGNVILFSVCDPDDSVLENHAYTWKQNGYAVTEADIPSIGFSIDDELMDVAGDYMGSVDGNSDAAEVISASESGLNALQENFPDLCAGPVIIAVAYKTTDGKTFWTKSWRVYDPVPLADAVSDWYVDANNVGSLAPEYADFFAKYGHGYNFYNSGYTRLVGTKVKLTFSKLASGAWNKDTSIIQSVEVYSTRPVLYVDPSAAFEGFVMPHILLPQKAYEEMELGSQLMYHQASIPLSSLAESSQDVTLTFGGNRQATEDTMDVDTGQLVRYGKLLSYNARFHFYKSVSRLTLGGVTVAQTTGTQKGWKVLVRYEDAEMSGMYRVASGATYYTTPAYLVVAPNLNIKEVVMYTTTGTTRCVRKYRMSKSTTYNFSYCDTGPYDSRDNVAYDSDEIVSYDAVTGDVVQESEAAALNVTEQYNPFVFLVAHSYLAPAPILDVQPQMSASVDNSYGTYPLNVFTTKGVYALHQGSANVLYGYFDSLTDVVADGGVPTETGTFFLGAGALWLVAGRRLTLVSDALSRGPHKYIRACAGYKKISGDQDDMESPVYDMAPYVSAVEFDVFAMGNGTTVPKGHLSFNRFREELYVSNDAYEYSYVLSLKYRQWFKVPWRMRQDEAGSVIAVTPAGVGTVNIVDLEDERREAHVDFHLQTRPFSYGYAYSHIHRIVAMMRAELDSVSGDKVVLGLYGSDDLIHWNLLSYAYREGADPALALSQVRTAPAARSWRYYTVCIGGQADTETELGPFIVDYTPVLRRMG